MKNKLKIVGMFGGIVGVILIIIGVWAMCFTYNNVTRENIVTGADASIPNSKVAGPLTLKSQADIIREHTLRITNGQTYAEMPRQIAKLDTEGKEILDANGEVVLVDNVARNTWITATTLTTSINLALLAYGLSLLTILLGLMSMINGYIFCELSKKETN
jgi:hypothetical protein